jgi:hypothetical protein
MQAQVSFAQYSSPNMGRRTNQMTNSNIADRHKEIYQCKLKRPTRLRLVSFIRKT